MLTRIVLESLARQRRRKLLSVAAIALGVAVATAVGTIALDVGDKVSRELRSFGANISVTPAADGLALTVGGVDYRPAASGAYLSEAALVKLKKIFWRNNIMAFAPFLSVPAEVRGRRIVLVGSWFDREMQVDKSDKFRTGLRELHPAWKVEGQWPEDGHGVECLVGSRLARALGTAVGEVITVEVAAPESGTKTRNSKNLSGAGNFEFRVRGILETGGPEDDEVFAPLETVGALAGLEGNIRRVEVSALTKPEDTFARSDLTKLNPEQFDRWYCTPYVGSIAYQIEQEIPGAKAKPVYQVAETEGRVLDRVGMLMLIFAVAALATAALAVASMILATVLERRVEIGLFKSLGATDSRVAAVFLLEAFAMSLVGGAVGYVVGSLMAWRLSILVFGLPAGAHWVILPVAVGLALLVTVVGSALPLGRGMKISPAAVLRD